MNVNSALPERFWSKVSPEPNTGCWLWMGAYRDHRGYGVFSLGGKNHYAHRLCFIDAKGEIPVRRELDHLCRQPSCVNPDHLEAVTRSTNNRRGLLGRKNTHCRYGHELTAENRYSSGQCKLCARERARRQRVP